MGGKTIVNYGSTSGFGLLPSQYFDNRMGIIVDIPSGTYSLYLKQSVNCYYGYIDSNGTHNLGNTHNSNYVASDTFTFNESLKFVIWYDSGFTGSNASEVFNLVLNGDAPTNQLPYGLNIYYPTNVKVVGRNLTPNVNKIGAYDGTTGEYVPSYTNHVCNNEYYIQVKPNTQYSFIVDYPSYSSIHLFYYEDYTTAKIAEIIDKKESTVRSLLHRGRSILKDVLKEGYDFE